MDNYILEGKTPRICSDINTWAKWFETADRVVAKTKIGDSTVSTVFLGIDHSFGDGPPLLFETMVFGGPLDDECERCSVWNQAEQQHKDMVRRVREQERDDV